MNAYRIMQSNTSKVMGNYQPAPETVDHLKRAMGRAVSVLTGSQNSGTARYRGQAGQSGLDHQRCQGSCP